jgi:hypothetical protein
MVCAMCHMPCAMHHVPCATHTPCSGLVSKAKDMTTALRGRQLVVSRPALQVLYFGAVCLAEGECCEKT